MNIRRNSILLCSFILNTFFVLQMVSAQSIAQYELTFDATWSPQTHPDRFPTGRNPHFTSLIGGTHNESVTFWEVGGTATSGVETMAETGGTSGVRSEVEAAISRNHAKSVLSGPSISPSPNRESMTFDIDSRWSLVTLTSMLAPSPDWFIGVSGLDLLDENGEWLAKKEVTLFAYDAGSEDGDGYSLSNPDTQPKEKIRRIEKAPFVVNGETRAVGTFVFELKSTKSIKVDPAMVSITEGEKEAVSVALSEKPTANVTVTISGFDNSDFDVITSFSSNPGTLTFTPSNFDQAQTIEFRLSEDNDAEPDSSMLVLSASGGGYDGISLNVPVRGVEDDLADAKIQLMPPSMLNVPPGGYRTFQVGLSPQPTGDVTVRLSMLKTKGLTANLDSLVFTPSNFENNPKLVIIRASEDANENDTETLILTGKGGGFDNAMATIDITVKPPSIPTLSLTVDPNPVQEGEIANIVLSISEEVERDVTVPLIVTNETSETEDYDIENTEFLIYRTPDLSATIRFFAKEDDDQENETLTVSLGDLPEIIAGAKKPDPVVITIEDNDIGAPTALLIHNSQGDTVDVYLDEEKLIEGFAFQETKVVNLPSEEFRLNITGVNSDNSANPLYTMSFPPQSGAAQYQMIIQKSSEDKLSLINLNVDEHGDSENSVALRIFHGAPDLGDLNLLILDAESSSPVDSITELSYGNQSRYIEIERKLVNIAISHSSTGQEIQVYKLDLSQSSTETQGLFLLSGRGTSMSEGFSPFGVWNTGEKFTPLITTSVEDHPVDLEDVSVGHYPNPFVNTTYLWFDLPETSEVDIQVVDLLGRTAFATLTAHSSGVSQFYEIDTSGWPAGVYLYRVIITSETGQSVSTGKMTKSQ